MRFAASDLPLPSGLGGQIDVRRAHIASGKRVLIVEDESLVALLLEDYLVEFGCTPVGPYSTVASALEAVDAEIFDVAVLDVNLDGERVYPVADVLSKQHVPFLFVSGYGDEAVPPDHSDWQVCPNPFKGNDLANKLAKVLDDV